MGCQHWSMSENFAEHTGGVQSVAFGPDGQTLASGSNAGIKLWDVSDGKCLRTLPGYSNWVMSLLLVQMAKPGCGSVTPL